MVRNIETKEILEKYYPGSSPSMVKFRNDIHRLCSPPLNRAINAIFLGGPIGVGKTFLASVIAALRESIEEGVSISTDKEQMLDHYRHILTPSDDSPLIESTIFGHMKDSFTGAKKDAPAIFENEACSPEIKTVFFDEIGRASLLMQGKLLGVYDGKLYKKVGGKIHIETKALLISASNQSLPNLIAEGKFLEELDSRLGIRLMIPALSERREQIKPLIEMMAQDVIRKPDEGDLAWAESYSWPGNMRQIRITMENYAFHTDKNFEQSALMSSPSTNNTTDLAQLETERIKQQLNNMLDNKFQYTGNAQDFIKRMHTNAAVVALHNWVYSHDNKQIEAVFRQDAADIKIYLSNAVTKQKKRGNIAD